MLEARSVRKLIFLCVLLTLLVFISCETQKKTDLVPRDLEQHIQNLKAADSLYTAGSYTCLKDAYDIYENLLDAPFQQEATAEKLFKTA
ncbi:MAG: hypothetical protein PVH84_18315, partial [Candidatus Aminicenantes bacterium]